MLQAAVAAFLIPLGQARTSPFLFLALLLLFLPMSGTCLQPEGSMQDTRSDSGTEDGKGRGTGLGAMGLYLDKIRSALEGKTP